MPSLALAWILYFSGWRMAGWMAGLTVIILLLSPAGAWAWLSLAKTKHISLPHQTPHTPHLPDEKFLRKAKNRCEMLCYCVVLVSCFKEPSMLQCLDKT